MDRTGSRPSRRQFVHGMGGVGLGLLAGCGRLPRQAPAQVAQIGFLSNSTPEEAGVYLDSLRQGLAELNLVEGQHITLEIRLAEGQVDRLGDLARELVRLPVAVIVAQGAAACRAAKAATSATPVIMTLVGGDPVRAGLVASLARPEGNVTGLNDMRAQLTGKRLELLKDVRPGLSRVGFLWTPGLPDRAEELADTEVPARNLGVSVHALAVSAANDLDGAFEAALGEHLEALFIQGNAVLNPMRARVVEFALRNRLPTTGEGRRFVVAGGLMFYGTNIPDQFRRAATYVDKILKGVKPADLPVERPTRFDFLINPKTAQALGLTIPPHVLLQATKLIQ